MEEALIKRVMPHSIEAEQSVVGAMLMDKDAITTAGEIISGDDFYQASYGVIFDSMIELFNEGKPVDLITLQERLKEKDVPAEIASLEFVRDLVTAVPTSANVKYYAQIVADKSLMRKMIKLNESIENMCYAGKEPVESIMEQTEKTMFQLLQRRTTGDYVPIKQVVLNALDKIEKASKSKGTVTGIPTGFIDLDYKLSGFQPSDFILIAARPSMGKTAFVLNIAQYMAFKKNKAVAIFSLEMSKEQLVNRLFSLESQVDAQSLRTGNMKDSDWEKLIEGAGIIGQSKLIIDDTPGISISELRSKCRKYKLEHGLDIIIIDYLQLMTGSVGRSSESRQQEVSDISRQLKGLARELNVPVVSLSQMLDRLGVEHFEIRKKEDLDRSFDGLILPGGESTVMRKLLIELDIYDILKGKIEDGLPVFGTCAGLILLADQVEDGGQCFGTMNILAKRNAYGRQLGSFYTEDEMKGLGKIPMTFIRAPYIADVYGNAETLAVVDGKVVAARQGSQLATAFHPELNDDTSVHAYFVEMIKGSKAQAV